VISQYHFRKNIVFRRGNAAVMREQRMERVDIVVVGAGAAGVGVGVVLRDLGVRSFCIVDRETVGASFLGWPAETRLLTPSFPGQGFGAMDLNAIALATSPGFTLEKEHLSGADYARYLRGVAEHWELPVQTGVEVQAVEPQDDGGFLLRTTAGELAARYVIWAAGEFQYPALDVFVGSEHCLHTSHVRRWSELEGEERLVIGGYESGIDVAIHLSRAGRRVRVIDPDAPWTRRFGDPSVSLSPFTRQRLGQEKRHGRIELVGEVAVERVEQIDGSFLVHGSDGQSWPTPQRPILATGFLSSLYRIGHLFDWHDGGWAQLSEHDESTRTPGLFVVGPSVRHETAIFCFIYKFRQRFAVVAREIGARLELDLAPLERYRREGMYLDDLTCCGTDCVC
jgi:putative flavoprotein involved in K+ transport